MWNQWWGLNKKIPRCNLCFTPSESFWLVNEKSTHRQGGKWNNVYVNIYIYMDAGWNQDYPKNIRVFHPKWTCDFPSFRIHQSSLSYLMSSFGHKVPFTAHGRKVEYWLNSPKTEPQQKLQLSKLTKSAFFLKTTTKDFRSSSNSIWGFSHFSVGAPANLSVWYSGGHLGVDVGMLGSFLRFRNVMRKW